MADLAIITAVALNGVIGNEQGMPWRLPSDLKEFKRLTEGCAVIMGRRTFQTLPAPLPNRTNVVLSHCKQRHDLVPDPDVYTGREVLAANSPMDAITAAESGEHQGDKIWVIGGGQIYDWFLEDAGWIYLTLVEAMPAGSTIFRWDTVRRVEWEMTAPPKRLYDPKKDQHPATQYVMRRKSEQVVQSSTPPGGVAVGP